jgi:2-polyprenyl-6-methoxyphenol hydroxylase-like FAD-dependent oxidoreductase
MSNATCDVSVIVVGGGPVGMTLANLLGVYGVDTVVVERSADILDFPLSGWMTRRCAPSRRQESPMKCSRI